MSGESDSAAAAAAAAEMFCVFGGFARRTRNKRSSYELLLWVFSDLEQADAAARGLVADPEMVLKHGCPVAVRFWYENEFAPLTRLDEAEQQQWENQAFSDIAEMLREVFVVRCVGGQPAELVERYSVDEWDGEVGGEE